MFYYNMSTIFYYILHIIPSSTQKCNLLKLILLINLNIANKIYKFTYFKEMFIKKLHNNSTWIVSPNHLSMIVFYN